jgi:hypothetical protein
MTTEHSTDPYGPVLQIRDNSAKASFERNADGHLFILWQSNTSNALIVNDADLPELITYLTDLQDERANRPLQVGDVVVRAPYAGRSGALKRTVRSLFEIDGVPHALAPARDTEQTRGEQLWGVYPVSDLVRIP